ncbi:glutaminyl-peptide cyclotransferase-like [Drosophila novamexicana]|uniref:glutaminyl-peptide cyclotransferase-like n=1 Tax=Drosophila novamexicana TaxID=47314 RepID=UPI0011E5BC66|nr:glutaminyl-peptide cyclotransferase-like [Drosophila novamexicana]
MMRITRTVSGVKLQSVLRVARFVSGLSIVLLLINYVLFIRIWREPLTFISDEKYFNRTLAKILRPRWSGSLGHSQVGDFLIEELQDLGFIALRDELFDEKIFTNFLGIMNTEASSFLLLTCHYDSKFLKNAANYVGATDGAVSCAILLTMARTLGPYLRGEFSQRDDIGLLLVFFDGHESLNEVEEDFNSLNGSRRFAEVETIPLKNIELVVTLNLIGAPNHIYMSHYEDTFVLHNRLADIERDMQMAGKLTKCHKLFHSLKDHESDIEDDHYPFLEEGVPVLHIVPHTYPDAWHTAGDNFMSLHWPTIRNMNAIIPRFVYEFLKTNRETA